MGNKCSCPCDLSFCCPWLNGEKKPNLPPKPEPAARPKPSALVDPDNVDYLAIKEWDWQLKKNGEEHHTDGYHQVLSSVDPPLPNEDGTKPTERGLVVRRGQSLYLTLMTNIPYNGESHKLSLMFFVTDATPNFGNGTQVGVKVGADEAVRGWTAKILSQEECTLNLEIKTPPSTIVGQWRLEVDTDTGGKSHCFAASQKLYILFNPWCPEDSVFMKDEDEKNEFVLSESGLIWRGTHSRLRPCPWQYGQFDKDVLESILYVLTHLCKLLAAHRSDPVKVVRAISAGINSPDDSGVLVGNWSDKFDGGRPPTEWRDSISILQEFYAKKKPVKYGQCWVFSGVVTTACRTLGIPCRPVTNFSSAHDTHNSLTIDYFFGDEGETIKDMNADSVWNFHVWNEVWMTRPDLGDDYGGWQVIDSTPQEQSDGQFRCGPSSLVAIKRGEIHRPYDVPFVYAEVNADTLYWKYQGKRQPMKLLGKTTGGVGLNISTKAVGKMRRDDITYLYKYNEDSKEERDVMLEALRRCENSFARYYLNEEFEEIKFQLHLRDDIVIGEPFSVSASMENKNDNEHIVTVVLRADTMLYTGEIKELVKKHEFQLTIKPRSSETVKLEISFDEYYGKLVDQCAFNMTCLGKVQKTNFEYFAQDDFRVRKPDIKITCQSDNIVMNQISKWNVSFKNPIPMKLSKGKFNVVPSCADSVFQKLKTNVDINADASFDFEITPKKAGEMTISVTFTSKELSDVDGFHTFTVVESIPPPSSGNGDQS